MTDGDFPEVPVSTIQTGNGPVQYLTPQPVPEEFKSFEPPKRYIIFESKQDELEEIQICDDEIFNESCQPLDFQETSEIIPQDAFEPPQIDQGNIADLDIVEQPPGHKYQESKKPMHTPTGKYHIMELFWFLNPKYQKDLDNIPLQEAHFCTLSFNIDFGNMKVTFYKVPNGALEGHKIYLMQCQRMTSVSIYPSSLFKLIRSQTDYKTNMATMADNKSITVTCMEQLIFKTNETWQQERPMAIFETDVSIKLTIRDPKYGESYYIFQNWQKDALVHAANFVLNQGLELTGRNIIAGNRV